MILPSCNLTIAYVLELPDGFYLHLKLSENGTEPLPNYPYLGLLVPSGNGNAPGFVPINLLQKLTDQVMKQQSNQSSLEYLDDHYHKCKGFQIRPELLYCDSNAIRPSLDKISYQVVDHYNT